MTGNVTSQSAEVVLAVIPIVGIVIVGIIIFFYLLWHHHEIKLQIKMGNYRPSKFGHWTLYACFLQNQP